MPLEARSDAALTVVGRPPRKQAGRPTGPRRFAGELLDVRAAAELLGCSAKCIRARVGRRLLPFHRFGGRVTFLRGELLGFIEALPGCSAEEARANVALRTFALGAPHDR